MNEVLKIIIADDNRKIEENEKYKVIGIAKDEEEEIKLIKDIKPNLVITDIRKKNGWTGLDIIKQFENEDNKPIFFVISGSTENYIEEIRTLQIKYYLNKPYNFDDITRILSYIYNDIYPMSIINCKSEITENKYMNFWNKIRKILKRI